MSLFIRIKYIYCLLLIQLAISACNARTVHDVMDNYSEILHKMTEELKNFTDHTYKNCSEQVMHVLSFNSEEFIKTKDFLREMHSRKDNILAESGMSFFPQMIKECNEKFNQESEELSKSISNAQEVCLMFISNVFTLVENPELYKNISDLQSKVDEIQRNCTNTSFVSEADECFKKEIYVTQPTIREMRVNVYLFLTSVDQKVKQMTNTLRKCYNAIRNEVIITKARKGARQFEKCITDKKVQQ